MMQLFDVKLVISRPSVVLVTLFSFVFFKYALNSFKLLINIIIHVNFFFLCSSANMSSNMSRPSAIMNSEDELEEEEKLLSREEEWEV